MCIGLSNCRFEKQWWNFVLWYVPLWHYWFVLLKFLSFGSFYLIRSRQLSSLQNVLPRISSLDLRKGFKEVRRESWRRLVVKTNINSWFVNNLHCCEKEHIFCWDSLFVDEMCMTKVVMPWLILGRYNEESVELLSKKSLRFFFGSVLPFSDFSFGRCDEQKFYKFCIYISCTVLFSIFDSATYLLSCVCTA